MSFRSWAGSLLGVSLFVLILSSCTHKEAAKEAQRVPTSETHSHEAHLTEQNQLDLRAMVRDRASAPLNVLLMNTRVAQTLVSSFDVRIKNVRTTEQSDALLQSELYCKIQRARGLYELAEEKILFSLEEAFKLGSEQWFLDTYFSFASKGPAEMAATVNLFRKASAKQTDICGTDNCLLQRLAAQSALSTLVGDDQAFSDFTTKNRDAIARYQNITATDLRHGRCFSENNRQPNQSGGYEWSKRQWISDKLSNGEFIITYDDGPHGQHTRQIMDMWEQSGFTKPAFFWLSQSAVNLKAIVQDARLRGFPIGLHSERHGDLGNLARSAGPGDLNSMNRNLFSRELAALPAGGYANWREQTLDREIVQAGATLERVVREVDSSYRLKHFRLPFGSGVKNQAIGSRLAQLDADHFYWKVDSLDWQDRNPVSVLERVKAQMTAGKKGLVLFHDTHASTVVASRLLIDLFKSRPDWQPRSLYQMVPQ